MEQLKMEMIRNYVLGILSSYTGRTLTPENKEKLERDLIEGFTMLDEQIRGLE